MKELIPIEDINYLSQQSSGKINMILAGMTTLMNDTDAKVEKMEKQNWFQRMVKTVTGKNRATKEEIRQNHDKLNAYMSEAIAELYNRNCIDHQVMISLGTQLNGLYAEHLHLKQMLGAFVTKLNAKIDSVDNFHMLTTEIEQGVYSNNDKIIAVCKVMSQFDNRIMEEPRKLDILRRSLENQKIVTEEEFFLKDFLTSVINIPMEEIGKIYLELSTIRNDFVANAILNIIEDYHFLPDIQRKMIKKDTLINNLIQREGLDDTVTLSMEEIYENFINNKIDTKNWLVPIDNNIENKIIENTSNTENEKINEKKENEIIEIKENYVEEKKQFSSEELNQMAGDIIEGKENSTNIEISRKKLFELILKLAEQGDSEAQYNLGRFYVYKRYSIRRRKKRSFKMVSKICRTRKCKSRICTRISL